MKDYIIFKLLTSSSVRFFQWPLGISFLVKFAILTQSSLMISYLKYKLWWWHLDRSTIEALCFTTSRTYTTPKYKHNRSQPSSELRVTNWPSARTYSQKTRQSAEVAPSDEFWNKRYINLSRHLATKNILLDDDDTINISRSMARDAAQWPWKN